MSYAGGTNYELAARVALCCFLVAMVTMAIYSMLRPGTPDPTNDKAFGCYTTPNAAPILLSRAGMTIFQRVPIQIQYHLERGKSGIALTADAPIAAEPADTQYVFLVKPPGVGRYLNFFNVIDGHSYGVFNEDDLKQFTMLAEDGTHLAYRRSPPKVCRF